MNYKLGHIVSSLLLLVCSFALQAQTIYPVQVYTQLIPPYTPFVPQYYTGTQAKLKVMLINADMQQPLLQVFLRMKITSSMFSLITPEYIRTPNIELMSGVPVSLSLQDLAVYFRRENLQVSGNQSEFYRTQLLPDNFYRFHFEVYEAATGKLLSNPRMGFAQAMIAMGDPPILNLPAKGKTLRESSIPNIMFTWTPKHFNSVAAAYGTEYEFTMVEIYDKQTSPEAAFTYSRVLYTETVRSTSFIHTIAQPPLIPGMRYAWRVRAVAKEGIEEVNVFKNNGYSPVFWFDYAAECKTVQTFGAVYDGGVVNITWNEAGSDFYAVEYRKKGTDKWYSGNSTAPGKCPVYNLQPGKEYEYRIGSRCSMNDAYGYSTIKGIQIPERPEKGPECGLLPDINLANQTPTQVLIPGLPVMVGDFPVFITKVSGSSPFSGEGYVGIPYLKGMQIAVTFTNIVVNTTNQLISGFFETKYDAENNLMFNIDEILNGGAGVGDVRSGEEKAEYVVDYTINPNIKVLPVKPDGTKDEIKEGGDYILTKGENGQYTFIITDAQGTEHKMETDAMPATIQDKDGNTFAVNENGSITPLSTHSTIILNDATKNKPRPDIATLTFEATPNTRYAVDPYQTVYEKVTEYFVKYKPTTEDMIASNKFMLPNASDEVLVKVTKATSGFNPDKVHFVTDKGKEYKGVYNASTQAWTLPLLGSEANDGQNLYVVQEESPGNYATLARLNIYSYEPKSLKVKLVPVNEYTNNFNANTVAQQLNAIYNKVGISCEVEMASSFNYEPLKTNAFNVTGSGLFSTLTDDMKALNAAYMQSSDYQDGMITLFMIENVTGAEGVAGDMPRGKQFGYLFNGATTQTIAHEIGHGVFHLDHPFDRANAAKSFASGDLNGNVMEYPPYAGNQFVKLQWDAIHAPGVVIGVFETDAGGMSQIISDDKLYACLEEIRQSLISGVEIQRSSYPIQSKGEIQVGGYNYRFITIKRMTAANLKFSIKGAKPELFTEKNIYGEEQYCIGYLNKTITIVLYSKEEREQLLSYLSATRSNSYLLFVSGYDLMNEVIDFIIKNDAKTKSETWWDDMAGFVNKTPVASDTKEYWGSEFVDNFVSRLRPKKVTYMTGYENIGTSNHKTISDFVTSLISSYTTRYTAGVACYVNPSCVVLHTKPNAEGFNQRRNNGKQRGRDYVNMLKAECVKGTDGLVHDTVDIVCHSMGFAHALGIIDDIREAMKSDLKGLSFGRFYIIAPENACSGEVNVNEWQEVWQYGADEANTPLWLQDGVAPQCPVGNIGTRRAYIPTSGVPRGFLESHKIKNYEWIFTKLQTKDDSGYVTPRK